MARPTPDELRDATKFALLDEIDHKEVVRHVRRYLWQPSLVSAAYLAANALVLAWIALIWQFFGLRFFEGFQQLSLGMTVGYLLLLPIHEHVHGLVYRWHGASQITVSYNWRNLTALCTADQFVVKGREFVWVCLMPFLAINSALIAVLLITGGSLFLAGMLLLHVGACSGDVALVNYVWQHRATEIFTYDELAQQRSFIYRPLDQDHS